MFEEELGEAKGVTANLYVSNTVKPWFCRARIVSHALKVKVEQILQQLIDQKSSISYNVRLGSIHSSYLEARWLHQNL